MFLRKAEISKVRFSQETDSSWSLDPITALRDCDSITYISGRGPTPSRNVYALSFNVEANQFILGSTLHEDIIVRCLMNSAENETETLAQLPLPMSYVYFTGVLIDCENSNDSHSDINVALLTFSILQ